MNCRLLHCTGVSTAVKIGGPAYIAGTFYVVPGKRHIFLMINFTVFHYFFSLLKRNAVHPSVFGLLKMKKLIQNLVPPDAVSGVQKFLKFVLRLVVLRPGPSWGAYSAPQTH